MCLIHNNLRRGPGATTSTAPPSADVRSALPALAGRAGLAGRARARTLGVLLILLSLSPLMIPIPAIALADAGLQGTQPQGAQPQGAQPQGAEPQGAQPQGDPAAGMPRRVFTDALGHKVAWSRPPERIVSLSPNLTEILFAIGCDARVVAGVTSYCTYPPQVAALPKVGGVADPSLEAVAALRPDLVLATRGNALEFMESLVRLGIPVYALEARGGLEQILALILEVGAVTGRPEGAVHLADSLRLCLEGVRARTAVLPVERRPRVYMGELEGAHWAAGPGSFIQGMIEAAGGENVGAVAPADWSPLSLEVIVARRPEVWLGAYGPSSGGDAATVRARALEILRTHEGWRDTPLGREPRMLLIDEDRLQRPGPRIFGVMEELARFLHPDLWPAAAGGTAR
jgi:iron complex transport system substrate-binding protein